MPTTKHCYIEIKWISIFQLIPFNAILVFIFLLLTFSKYMCFICSPDFCRYAYLIIQSSIVSIFIWITNTSYNISAYLFISKPDFAFFFPFCYEYTLLIIVTIGNIMVTTHWNLFQAFPSTCYPNHSDSMHSCSPLFLECSISIYFLGEIPLIYQWHSFCGIGRGFVRFSSIIWLSHLLLVLAQEIVCILLIKWTVVVVCLLRM